MAKKPGDSFGFQFSTQNGNGALTDADATPTGTLVRLGVDDTAAGTTVTIVRVSLGLYKATGAIPAGYARGDDLQVRINATVGGVASGALRDYGTLDSKRVGDLNDAAVLTDYQQRGTAITLPANPPADWLNAAAVKADAVTKVQAGLSTYAGGAVASVTAPVTVATVNDKTGYSLASTGLDSISITAPTGPATTFPRMVVQTWRRFFRPSTMTASQIKTYADDGTTVITTQAVSDDGTTQTQGTAT